jgi:Ubiquitin carboxyl-terminal hydrolase
VSHHGKNPNAGHYTADVRQPDGRWLRFDDATVTSVPLSMVRHLPTLDWIPSCLSAACLPVCLCSLLHPATTCQVHECLSCAPKQRLHQR